MFRYCPGAKSIVEPQIFIRKCPFCGEEVEFFEYETKQECPGCGKTVYREPTEMCIIWCDYADKCISVLVRERLIDHAKARELRNILKEHKNK